MLALHPKMLPRLDEIEEDLLARRARAEHEAWLGEVEGIDLTFTFLRQKRGRTSGWLGSHQLTWAYQRSPRMDDRPGWIPRTHCGGDPADGIIKRPHRGM